MNNAQSIIEKIKKTGFYTLDINKLIDIPKVRMEFEDLIKSRKINIPRTPIQINKELNKSNLNQHHETESGKNYSIDIEDFEAGEDAYRDKVVHVTAKDPLIQIPSLTDFVFSSFVQDIADEYLDGEAALGYAKVKKSYANQLTSRSYNHKFHIDDNASKILKFIFYLNDVGTGGGAFHYVKGSHLDNEFRHRNLVTFEDTEIANFFGKAKIHELKGKAGTCIICDTIGIHKEGFAIETDRYSVIVNYVLEPEYGGSRRPQIINYDCVMSLPEKNKRIAKFLDCIHE